MISKVLIGLSLVLLGGSIPMVLDRELLAHSLGVAGFAAMAGASFLRNDYKSTVVFSVVTGILIILVLVDTLYFHRSFKKHK